MNPLVLKAHVTYLVYNKKAKRYTKVQIETNISAEHHDIQDYMKIIHQRVKKNIPSRFSFILEDIEQDNYRITACKVVSAKRKKPKNGE